MFVKRMGVGFCEVWHPGLEIESAKQITTLCTLVSAHTWHGSRTRLQVGELKNVLLTVTSKQKKRVIISGTRISDHSNTRPNRPFSIYQ